MQLGYAISIVFDHATRSPIPGRTLVFIRGANPGRIVTLRCNNGVPYLVTAHSPIALNLMAEEQDAAYVSVGNDYCIGWVPEASYHGRELHAISMGPFPTLYQITPEVADAPTRRVFAHRL